MTADQAAALSVGDVHQLMQATSGGKETDQPGRLMLDELGAQADAAAALVAVTDEGLRAIAAAFEGTQRIQGRDGAPGATGPAGPTGADATILFVDGSRMERRIDSPGGGLIYIGRGPEGAGESVPGWYLERVTISPETGLTVASAGAIGNGSTSWADRADVEYSPAPAKTALLRSAFVHPSTRNYVAEHAPSLLPFVTDRLDEVRALVEGRAVA